jgi:hypothetical protein
MNKTVERVMGQLESCCRILVERHQMYKMPTKIEMQVAIEIEVEEMQCRGQKTCPASVLIKKALDMLTMIDFERHFDRLIMDAEEDYACLD